MTKLVRILNKYFQSVADVLDGKKKISEVFPNTTDSGQTREGILRQFLEDHLPHRCKVVQGGFIFDSDDHESTQMDLIIHNDLALQFNTLRELSQKSFVTIEGCYAVISVKTSLDKKQLEDSLKGFSTIPKTPNLNTAPTLKLPKLSESIPLRIIFAFSGISSSVIKSHLENYYKDNPTPFNEQPRLIIVNNQYCIIRTVEVGITNAGTQIPSNTFFLSDPINDKKGAYFLHYLLNDLQSLANIGPHMIINHSLYLDNSLSDFD